MGTGVGVVGVVHRCSRLESCLYTGLAVRHWGVDWCQEAVDLERARVSVGLLVTSEGSGAWVSFKGLLAL